MPYTSDSHEYERLVQDFPHAVRILAEGDSWFAYPRRFLLFGAASNVVDHLGKSSRYVIYTTASNGDEAVAMMSGEQKHAMMKRIRAHHYDFILFSGGGNDIVGRFDFDHFVDRKTPGMPVLDCINRRRLNRKLEQIAAVHEELIERVAQFSGNPATRVVTHTYDYALPSPKGFELFDVFPLGESWMHPILMERNITDPQEQRLLVREMLHALKARLMQIQAAYPERFVVVDTQGLLHDGQWRNEIHPTPAGFRLVARKIAAVLTPAG